MQDWPRNFVQTRVTPMLTSIEIDVLRLGYTSIPALAHLMAREVLARSAVAAIKRLPYPGVVAPDAMLDSRFVPLLKQAIDEEFERVRADPGSWIVPGHPLDLIPRPILPPDYATLASVLVTLWRILDLHLDGWVEDDVRYIAQYILDAGVLPQLEDKAPAKSERENANIFQSTVIMEPLVAGGPTEVAPVYDDVHEPDIHWSDDARHDGDVYDWFIGTFILASSSTAKVEDFRARLENVEWLEGALSQFSERKQALILHEFVYGMDFDVAALSDGVAPDDVLLEIFDALTQLWQLWDEDHPWA